jgi:hypothetical protein
MTEERGKPRLPRFCSDHQSAPRMPGPRPPQIRGAMGQPFYSQEQIKAAEELAEEAETE